MMESIAHFMNSPVTGGQLVMACAITFTVCGIATLYVTPEREK